MTRDLDLQRSDSLYLRLASPSGETGRGVETHETAAKETIDDDREHLDSELFRV